MFVNILGISVIVIYILLIYIAYKNYYNSAFWRGYLDTIALKYFTDIFKRK